MFTINHIVEFSENGKHTHELLHEILKIVNINNKLNLNIIGKFEDLQAEQTGLKQDIANLQTSLDAEQEQLAKLLEVNAGVVNTLNEKIAQLEEEKANSANPEQLDAIIEDLKATRASIATTKADLEGTVNEEPNTDPVPDPDPNGL